MVWPLGFFHFFSGLSYYPSIPFSSSIISLLVLVTRKMGMIIIPMLQFTKQIREVIKSNKAQLSALKKHLICCRILKIVANAVLHFSQLFSSVRNLNGTKQQNFYIVHKRTDSSLIVNTGEIWLFAISILNYIWVHFSEMMICLIDKLRAIKRIVPILCAARLQCPPHPPEEGCGWHLC